MQNCLQSDTITPRYIEQKGKISGGQRRGT